EIGRLFLLLIGGNHDSRQQARNFLLFLQVFLLALQQIGRNAFGNLGVCLSQHIEQRPRSSLFRNFESRARVFKRFAVEPSSRSWSSQQRHRRQRGRSFVKHIFRRSKERRARFVGANTAFA